MKTEDWQEVMCKGPMELMIGERAEPSGQRLVNRPLVTIYGITAN